MQHSSTRWMRHACMHACVPACMTAGSGSAWHRCLAQVALQSECALTWLSRIGECNATLVTGCNVLMIIPLVVLVLKILPYC